MKTQGFPENDSFHKQVLRRYNCNFTKIKKG